MNGRSGAASRSWKVRFWPGAAQAGFGCLMLVLALLVGRWLDVGAIPVAFICLVVIIAMSVWTRAAPPLVVAVASLFILRPFFRPPGTLAHYWVRELFALGAFASTSLIITGLRAKVGRAVADLLELQRRIRLVVDTVPALIWRASLDGASDFLSQRWSNYTGLSLQEALGWGWTAAVYDEDRPAFVAAWKAAMAAGTTFETEVRLRRADGEARGFLIRALPLLDSAGAPQAWYASAVDIEDRRRAEDAVRQLQAELARVARMTTMGEMAATIAHEVNQPLSGVVLNGDACLRWLAGDAPNLQEARAAVEHIMRDAKRASEVIARIRQLSTKGAAEKEPVDLNQAIAEVAAFAQSELRKAGVTLRTDLGPNLPRVMGDRVQLQQVVLNLVINGLEAMSSVAVERRELVIQTQRENATQVRVAVRDAGSGLDPASADRVFEPFYTTKRGGMGMGLCISRSIIESHGGRLWAEANQGPGTTFVFVV